MSSPQGQEGLFPGFKMPAAESRTRYASYPLLEEGGYFDKLPKALVWRIFRFYESNPLAALILLYYIAQHEPIGWPPGKGHEYADPSVKRLRQAVGHSDSTVLAVRSQLERQGVLERRDGSNKATRRGGIRVNFEKVESLPAPQVRRCEKRLKKAESGKYRETGPVESSDYKRILRETGESTPSQATPEPPEIQAGSASALARDFHVQAAALHQPIIRPTGESLTILAPGETLPILPAGALPVHGAPENIIRPAGADSPVECPLGLNCPFHMSDLPAGRLRVTGVTGVAGSGSSSFYVEENPLPPPPLTPPPPQVPSSAEPREDDDESSPILSKSSPAPERSCYSIFHELYPRERWHGAKTKPAFVGLSHHQQEAVIRLLREHLKCELWTRTPKYIPLSSNFLEDAIKCDFEMPPPPYVQPSSGRASPEDAEAEKQKLRRIQEEHDEQVRLWCVETLADPGVSDKDKSEAEWRLRNLEKARRTKEGSA